METASSSQLELSSSSVVHGEYERTDEGNDGKSVDNEEGRRRDAALGGSVGVCREDGEGDVARDLRSYL